MKQTELLKAELSILRSLRRVPSARFSVLMKPTGLQSDAFKFHIRRLVELEYIKKQPQGDYALTLKGKEFANNLDEATLKIQKQPKLSVLIIAHKPDEPSILLFQRRQRQPYYGFYGFITGPVRWGEEIEAAAQRELQKQAGLQATFCVKGFYRQKDHDVETNQLLEDKLFAIVEATVTHELPKTSWTGGQNKWMSTNEYGEQEKRFSTTDGVLAMLKSKKTYDSSAAHYSVHEY